MLSQLRFDQTITVGNLITMFAAIFAAISGWFILKGRIHQIERDSGRAAESLQESRRVVDSVASVMTQLQVTLAALNVNVANLNTSAVSLGSRMDRSDERMERFREQVDNRVKEVKEQLKESNQS